MKKFLLMLLALALSNSMASAQSEEPWATKLFIKDLSDKSQKPDLVHDFGTVAKGTVVKYQFPVRNHWAVPLEFVEVRPSCGKCSSAAASKRILQPRESGYIEVIMNTAQFDGAKNISVTVTVSGTQQTTNEYFGSSVQLKTTCTSRTDVVFKGDLNFGVVGRGQKATKTAEVVYAGFANNWQISNVITNDAPVDVTFKKIGVQPVSNYFEITYLISATLKADASVGDHKHQIVLKTNDANASQLPIFVEATIQSALTVTPESISLASLKVGESLSKQVIVRGSGGTKFRITAVVGSGVTYEEANPDPAPVHRITIKFQANQAGEFHRDVVIKTELGDVTVKADGTVVP